MTLNKLMCFTAGLAALVGLSLGPVGLSTAAHAQQAEQASPLKDMGPYAGTSESGFYDPAQRIAQLHAKIQQGQLAGPAAKAARARLNAISADLKARIARKNGNLLDWDRELINQKLDAFVKRYPTLAI